MSLIRATFTGSNGAMVTIGLKLAETNPGVMSKLVAVRVNEDVHLVWNHPSLPDGALCEIARQIYVIMRGNEPGPEDEDREYQLLIDILAVLRARQGGLMEKQYVIFGGLYLARIGRRKTYIRIVHDTKNEDKWDAVDLGTGKSCVVSASQILRAASSYETGTPVGQVPARPGEPPLRVWRQLLGYIICERADGGLDLKELGKGWQHIPPVINEAERHHILQMRKKGANP